MTIATGGSSSGRDVVRGWPTILTGAGVALLFAVSPTLLDFLDFGYSTPTGSALAKVHPGTDLIFLAFALAAVRSGNPLRYAAAEARRFPGVALHLGAAVLLVVYLMRVQRAPFTPVIDTFVMPGILFVLLADLSDRARTVLERFLHVFMVANASLGLAEFLTGWRLVPVSFGGIEFTAEIEWRAFGLFGHPLSSATGTGLYAIVLAMGFGAAMPAALRWPAVALQLAALVGFGGRTALVMTLAVLAGVLAVNVGAVLAGRRFDPLAAGVALFVAALVAGGLFALANAGFFDLLLSRFADDAGSARARALIVNVFRHLSWSELVFGPDQDHLASVLHYEGIEVGVESFWLGFVVLCGLGMSTIVFVAVGLFMADVMARVDGLALVPLAFFTVIVSVSISLSAKSISLGQFVATLMLLMPARPRTAPVADRAGTRVAVQA